MFTLNKEYLINPLESTEVLKFEKGESHQSSEDNPFKYHSKEVLLGTNWQAEATIEDYELEDEEYLKGLQLITPENGTPYYRDSENLILGIDTEGTEDIVGYIKDHYLTANYTFYSKETNTLVIYQYLTDEDDISESPYHFANSTSIEDNNRIKYIRDRANLDVLREYTQHLAHGENQVLVFSNYSSAGVVSSLAIYSNTDAEELKEQLPSQVVANLEELHKDKDPMILDFTTVPNEGVQEVNRLLTFTLLIGTP